MQLVSWSSKIGVTRNRKNEIGFQNLPHARQPILGR
jgi:hypothetical protein